MICFKNVISLTDHTGNKKWTSCSRITCLAPSRHRQVCRMWISVCSRYGHNMFIKLLPINLLAFNSKVRFLKRYFLQELLAKLKNWALSDSILLHFISTFVKKIKGEFWKKDFVNMRFFCQSCATSLSFLSSILECRGISYKHMVIYRLGYGIFGRAICFQNWGSIPSTGRASHDAYKWFLRFCFDFQPVSSPQFLDYENGYNMDLDIQSCW